MSSLGYPSLFSINLVDKKGMEKEVGNAYGEMVGKANTDKIKYCYY